MANHIIHTLVYCMQCGFGEVISCLLHCHYLMC